MRVRFLPALQFFNLVFYSIIRFILKSLSSRETSLNPDQLALSAKAWPSIAAGDLETAKQVAVQYREAELGTSGRLPEGRTESDMGTLILYAVAHGQDVPLVEIDPNAIETMQLTAWQRLANQLRRLFMAKEFNRPGDREQLLREIIKTQADFAKVPPIVVSLNEQGKYSLFDGQTRTHQAQKMKMETIRAYLLPDDYQQGEVISQAAAMYRQVIPQFKS